MVILVDLFPGVLRSTKNGTHQPESAVYSHRFHSASLPRRLLQGFTIGSLRVLLDNVPITSGKFLFHRVVGRIATTIAQSTPGTRGHVVVRLFNHSAVGIVTFSTLLAFLAFAGLGLSLLLTRSFFAGLSRAALLAVGTALLFFLFLDHLGQHCDDLVLLDLSHFIRLDQLKAPTRVIHSLVDVVQFPLFD